MIFMVFYKVLIAIIFSLDKFTDSIAIGAALGFNHYSKQCQIPEYPPHTKYYAIFYNQLEIRKDKPGENVPSFSVLITECDRKHQLINPSLNTTICANGRWSFPPPNCLRSCPPLLSTTSTNVTCKYDNALLDNCDNPVEGTTAIVTCNPLHYEPDVKKNPQYYCNNGRWTPHLSPCEPDCGIKRPRAVTNIIGGNSATRGDYPWHVAIYNDKNDYICGGSIIKRNIVLSAAHCFTDADGNRLPAEKYFVAAGKYYSKHDDTRDTEAQFSMVSKIHIPERYKAGLSYQANDIALLILTTPFKITLGVQLVCVESNREILHLDTFSTDKRGIVTGWGYTAKDNTDISNVLREIEIPFISYQKCFDEVPTQFTRFITSDKICGGYVNSSKGVCQGDSGGALVFTDNMISDQYFVKGIVSVSPATDVLQCDSNQYSVYTSVNKHIGFINDILTRHPLHEFIELSLEDDENGYNPTFAETIITSCVLPNFPPNGKYTVSSQTNSFNYKPGQNVPEASILSLTCDTSYTSDDKLFKGSVCTENGEWEPSPPKCTRACPSLISSASTNVKCEYNGKTLRNCENPKEGTVAFLSCNTFYEDSSLLINPIRSCVNSRWNSSIPECTPMCGDPTDMHETFAWHVGIYNSDKKFVCSGSIISTKIILSAAQCFTDYYGVREPIDNYYVAGGKVFRKFYDRRDNHAQYSTILQIHIPKTYLGRKTYNTFDIAIIILREPFFLSKVIQPICLDWTKRSRDLEISQYNNGIGEITGWGYLKDSRQLSDVLQGVKFTYIPSYKCYQSLPLTFRKYFTYDKICGEHITDGDESPVCGGNRGGGLVFYNVNEERYYIKGIVSVTSSVDEHQCELEKYGIYTSVDIYTDYLKDVITNNS